ncbi:type VII secretion protein EccB [Leucobacter coleopterorum]|uniref:Type VII secretion protein EccB n=1 Tax=Leucobacter coleopterorum TaxID=2714933 RepID=A0ABX6K2I7_9MICO|nr:type VII secretion protein EccB [Leucobacter coleopterorum]QIM19349.1 type VII secretion protein EccB [Leucobacter coleopterorum]
MATKKDLIEAQQFSRNRLLSAFIGGAPGGKELEPAKPMRAVFGGIALSVMIIIAGLFIGFLNPGLPSGWENNRLVVARDTGARYVSADGTLHPVINTVSARMIIPPGEFEVISVNQSSLSGVPIGGTIGILGGPDTLPKVADIDGTRWRACAAEQSTELWISGQDRTPAGPDTGTVVVRDAETFVISDGTSFAVPRGQETAVLRALGLDTVKPHEVRGEWLALFKTGADLTPLKVEGAGQKAPGTSLSIGAVVHPAGNSEEDRYLITAEGKLAPLSPLAHRLYMLGTASNGLGETSEMSPSELATLPTTESAGGIDWPKDRLTPHPGTGFPCATLSGGKKGQHTVLAQATFSGAGTSTEAASTPNSKSNQDSVSSTGIDVHIPENTGALVRGGPAGALTLIDSTGMAYSVPGDLGIGLERLGYTKKDVAVMPAEWLHLLTDGPELTPEAAGTSPKAS